MSQYTRLMTRSSTLRTITQGLPDTNGDPTETVVETEALCDLQQSTAYERTETGTIQTSQWNYYCAPGTDLAAVDEVEVDGKVYHLFGDAWTVRHPRTGEETHVQCVVREVR